MSFADKVLIQQHLPLLRVNRAALYHSFHSEGIAHASTLKSLLSVCSILNTIVEADSEGNGGSTFFKRWPKTTLFLTSRWGDESDENQSTRFTASSPTSIFSVGDFGRGSRVSFTLPSPRRRTVEKGGPLPLVNKARKRTLSRLCYRVAAICPCGTVPWPPETASAPSPASYPPQAPGAHLDTHSSANCITGIAHVLL